MSGDRVVALAREWLGTPYRHRASVIGAGCDCLGLLRGVWRGLHGDEPMAVPAYRADMRDPVFAGALEAAAERLLVPVCGEPAGGQVVLFWLNRAAGVKHCGILVSSERFIHAQERLGVVEVNLTDAWRRRVVSRWVFPTGGSGL
jgi:NlpC/P60 family putative phage cell wall peptidase